MVVNKSFLRIHLKLQAHDSACIQQNVLVHKCCVVLRASPRQFKEMIYSLGLQKSWGPPVA